MPVQDKLRDVVLLVFSKTHHLPHVTIAAEITDKPAPYSLHNLNWYINYGRTWNMGELATVAQSIGKLLILFTLNNYRKIN